MSDTANWRLDRHIPSDTQEGFDIIRQVAEQLSARSWSEPEVFAVHLALEEALVNAIKHGNAGQSDKLVHVVIDITPDKFACAVTDQGIGFDPNCVPDPTDDENLCRDCGRGIALMREFMDEVRFVDCGNSVHMTLTRKR